jgi:hypothetical protein
MDVYAPIALPHFDSTKFRLPDKNFARSQLGRVVVAARKFFRRRDMGFRVEEKAPVGAQP